MQCLYLSLDLGEGKAGVIQRQEGGRVVWEGYYLLPPTHPKEVEGKALLFHLNPSESHSGHGLCPWTPEPSRQESGYSNSRYGKMPVNG